MEDTGPLIEWTSVSVVFSRLLITLARK